VETFIGAGVGATEIIGAGVGTTAFIGAGVGKIALIGARVRKVSLTLGADVSLIVMGNGVGTTATEDGADVTSIMTGTGVGNTSTTVGAGVSTIGCVGLFVGFFDVGNDMACVIRVQNSISSVSSLCLSTLCTLLNIFSAEEAVPPNTTKMFAALFRYIVLVVALIDETEWYVV
jgi:hypothetical protein